MSDLRSGNSTAIAEKSDLSLLRQLKSLNAGPAWTEFLNRYASLILQTASQFEYEQDRKNDCFLFICEKLSDAGFKRLLQYDSRRNASFRTWLNTVVFNLCVDWHRKEFGRAVLLPAISALPTFDQFVYRYSFEQDMSAQECLQALGADFPDVTRPQLSRAISRIHALLTPRQRWQISVRNHRGRPTALVDDSLFQHSGRQSAALTDPVSWVQKQQELDTLQTALEKLPARQRLLLHLRFHDGLTLKQIARLIRLGDSARAWRHIQAAIKALTDQFPVDSTIKIRKK